MGNSVWVWGSVRESEGGGAGGWGNVEEYVGV